MARGRMINQTIDFDPEFNALSIEAQLLYLRSLAFLDRDGLIIGHPYALLSRVAPLMDKMLPDKPFIVDEWVQSGLVVRYSTKGMVVLFFKGFGKNQSGMHYDRETPSRFAPPPGWTCGPKGLVRIDSEPEPNEPLEEVPTESEPTPTEPNDNVQIESGESPEEVRIESGLSPAQIEVEVKDQDQIQEQQGDEEEDAQVRDVANMTWQESYGEPIPRNLRIRIDNLVAECGDDAVAYAIHASKDADARNFRYIAQCARNYIPAATNGNTNGYAVELPGVFQLQPSEEAPPVAKPPPLPPIGADNPWATALAEIMPTLTGPAQSWLTGSRMERGKDIEGIPLYRIVVEPRAAAGVEWLTKQTNAVIRRTLGSILRQRIVVEIVAEEMETAS